jgi:Flp pilus assembly protein TadG
MKNLKNEQGTVIVFATLMIVLLLVMVGLGLDTGHLTYVRNQGQAAVDSAALAAVTGLPFRDDDQVKSRARGFNSKNTYAGSATNMIGNDDVSYVQYDFATNTITNYAANVNTANGVRVSLESASSISTPMFLTPLFNLMGIPTEKNKNVSVSAVSVITTRPAIPIALWSGVCNGSTPVPDVKIMMQHPDQKADSGENACWTTFFDCSSGAPDIKAGFETAGTCSGNSISGTLGIGSMICQNKGQVNTVLGEAEDFFLKNNPGQWWIVPVLAGTGNCAASNPTAVTDFAKIYPKSVEKSGNPKYIVADIVCNQTLDDLSLSMCFNHRLVREKAKNM